jgi:hypothetical protein
VDGMVLDVKRWLPEHPGGRGLHSSTFQLNVSTFCGIRWVPSVDRGSQLVRN